MKRMILKNSNPLKLFIACGVLIAFSSLSFAEDDDHEGGEKDKIELSLQQIKYADIGLDVAGEGKIREFLPVYGSIVVNAEREQMVSARYQGTIKKVTKRVGDPVKKGDTLLTIQANDSLTNYSIRSEIDGVIIQRDANIGEQTNDKILYTVQDFSNVWVELSLFPKDVAKVNKNQTVRIKSVDRQHVADGNIIYLAAYSQQANQAKTIRVSIDNREGVWNPGNFVNGEIVLSETIVSTTIKNEAIQMIDGKASVFVKEGEYFVARSLKLGRSDGELTEALAGIENGETYAVKNSFTLKSELGKGEVDHDD